MREFIWATILLWGLETALKVIALGKGVVAQSTTQSYAVEIIIVTGFIIWGAILLSA